METMMISDTELIAQIAGRNKEAFREFHRRHAGSLYAIAYSQLNNHDWAQEALQEVFASFLNTLFAGKIIKEPLRYLTHALRAQSVLMRNKNRRLQNLPENWMENPKLSRSGNPGRGLEEVEEKEIIWKEVSRLPENQREVLLLHLIQDMTFEEIAKLLDLPVSTLLTRYYSALDKLKPHIRRNT